MHTLPQSVPLTLQLATADPRLCPRLLDTHRQVWASLLWGHCSFLLRPGVHKVLFVPSKSVFPQSYVSFGSFMVGLMVTSSKRVYAIPRSTAPRAPVPAAVHCLPILHRRHSDTHHRSWWAHGLLLPIAQKFFKNYENTMKKLEVIHQKIG